MLTACSVRKKFEERQRMLPLTSWNTSFRRLLVIANVSVLAFGKHTVVETSCV